MSQPDYLISTPENVDLHLELAGLGNRILAACIDTTLSYLIVLLLAAGCVCACVAADLMPIGSNLKSIATYGLIGMTILACLFTFFGYHIYFEGLWHGQTPGKRVAHIRVVEQNGQTVTWGSVIIRNLLRVVDTGIALVGLIVILIDKNERRIGDLAAGTLVIRERPRARVNLAPQLSTSDRPTSFIDTGRLSPTEYELLVSFLERRARLSRAQRPLLAKRLEHYYRTKLEEPPNGDSPERFLETLYLAYQDRADQKQ